MRTALYILLAIFLTIPAGGPAAAQQTGEPMVIATRDAPPFAMQGRDGEWEGVSISLWRDMMEELDLPYRFEAASLEDMVQGVADGRFGAGVAALTVTREREEVVDFTHPFHTTGYGIAVRSEAGWWLGLRNLFSPAFLSAVGALALILLASGFAMWLFERKRNPDQFGGSTAQGIGAGFWWSAVTMTTVGYGDKAPVTTGGRAVALVWMFASVIIISGFTAAIASAITVGSLSTGIGSLRDLRSASVGTVPASASAAFLETENIAFQDYETVDAALAALAGGKLEAVVYDAPLLQYRLKMGPYGGVEMLDGLYGRQDYAVSLPPGSPLREGLNQAMLRQMADPEWNALKDRYLGKDG